MDFELFDPERAFAVRQGNLPHWYQPDVTYFITFRTDDSVPQPLLKEWHRRRDDWLRRHGCDPSKVDWQHRLNASPKLHAEYHTTFTREFMEYLDRGYGECLLRDPHLAELVASALHHFDGLRYTLSDFVIMPNHVHVLTCLQGETNVERQCRSWKTYSAGEINECLCRKGRFWQEESFDHLVRSAEQFEYLKSYIAENPQKAKLTPGQFLHWQRM